MWPIMKSVPLNSVEILRIYAEIQQKLYKKIMWKSKIELECKYIRTLPGNWKKRFALPNLILLELTGMECEGCSKLWNINFRILRFEKCGIRNLQLVGLKCVENDG